MANEVEDISQSNHLLSLKWNNHSSNFKVAIASLQEKAVLSDATIACDDHLFPVHKLVLSTCSDFFARVFSSTPCKHPVIVLHDLPHQNFAYLLSYMYAGEVNVPQTHLPTLIKAAETLQIKGLAAPDEEPAQGFLSAINGHSERESSLEKSYSKLKKRKCLTSDNTGNSSNQGSLTEVEDNLVSSAKRSKKFNTNESNRRESGLSSISENDHAPSTEGKSAQTSHDRVKNEHSSITAVSQDDSYEEQGVQIKEEEECGDQDEEDDDEGAVSQMWVEQQQSAQVNWSNEGSSNDLSWLPFPASRDRLGLLMEGEEDGEGSHGGALRNSNTPRSAPAGDVQLDLPPSLMSPPTAASVACDANMTCSVQDAPSLYDSYAKFSKISWADSSAMPKRRMSFDGCNGATDFRSSLMFNANSSEARSLPMNSSQFRLLSSAFNMKQCSSNRSSHRQLLCPYPNCGYVTDRESWLKTHVRKHTGERPFSCPHCPYRSAQKSNLTVHVKKVHAKDREDRDGFFPSASVTANRFVHLSRRSTSDATDEQDVMAEILRSPFRDSITDGALTSKNSIFTSSSNSGLMSPHLETLGSLLKMPSSSPQQHSISSQAQGAGIFLSAQQISSVAAEVSSSLLQHPATPQDEALDQTHNVP